MIRVLVTAAGSAGTIEVIRSLRSMGRYYVIALDSSPYAYGLRIADAGYVVPSVTGAEYPSVLRRILEVERPDFFVPFIDEELLLVHDLASEVPMTPLTPSVEFCHIALDKWETHRRLRIANLPTPDTWLMPRVQDAVFPAVLKPRHGRGSRGVQVVGKFKDVSDYFRHGNLSPSDIIIQRRITGREFTVSCVATLDGELLAVVPKEVIAKRGITQVGVTRTVPAIDDLCAAIHREFQPHGPFNVQLMLDESGQPWVFEVNARFSSTVALTIAAGIHEVDVVIRRALGETVGSLTYVLNTTMLRYVEQVFMPETLLPRA